MGEIVPEPADQAAQNLDLRGWGLLLRREHRRRQDVLLIEQDSVWAAMASCYIASRQMLCSVCGQSCE
jgi:hypothetical protein